MSASNNPTKEHLVVAEVRETRGANAYGPAVASILEDFGQFTSEVRRRVEARMATWLDQRVGDARVRGHDIGVVADAVRQLALRGGKRLRSVLIAAAYEACGGEGGPDAVAGGGVAIELFQTYLLIHDDLIDKDEIRRGGPSVPAVMRASFGHERAAAMAILAGDLACAWSHAALLEADFTAARVALALRELTTVHEQVVEGQILDVASVARDVAEVETMHALKTASYSVRAPVLIGARLAGASDRQAAALAAFAEPLGIAFQLRDDVLGSFGDMGVTGKPFGSDLREGRHNALIVDAMRDARVAECLRRVLGRHDAPEGDLREAVAAIEACGARARIERRIVDLAARASDALDEGSLVSAGRILLKHSIDALTERRT